jgi:hypothetical protein
MVKAQDSVSIMASRYKVDFTVPDFPAFKVLDEEPSDLLKPSIPQVISFIISNIPDPQNLSLPGSFAAEIAPWQLIRYNKVTLREYRDNAFLNSIRISIGTSERNDTINLGMGLKFTFINKGDLRTNPDYITENLKKLRNREIYKETLREQYQSENPFKPTYPVTDTIPEHEKIYEQELAEYFKERERFVMDNSGFKKYNEALEKEFEALKREYEENNWNKEKLDFAFGVLGSSPDTLAQNVRFNKFAGWLTYSSSFNDWTQYLIGTNVNYFKGSDKVNFNLSVRLYAGVNWAKGFIEGQYGKNNVSKTETILASLGAEIKVFEGYWLTYYAGLENNYFNSQKTSNFESHFDMRYTVP